MFHDLLEFTLGPLTRDKPNANSSRPCTFKNWYSVWMRVKTIVGPISKFCVTNLVPISKNL